MKVVCVSNRDKNGSNHTWKELVPGREYTVLGIAYDDLRISVGHSLPVLYPAHLFSVVDNSIDSRWKISLDDDGGIRMSFPPFMKPGFWEDVHDQDVKSLSILADYMSFPKS